LTVGAGLAVAMVVALLYSPWESRP
jgi:hypothetical protein